MLRRLSSIWVLLLAGCGGGGGKYPNRPITLVCPWAAGGGTDRVSRQMAVHLEHVLGVPVNVINATGGKGVTGHSHGLHARPDGYTLTMVTLELNMMHWSGLTELTYKDCTPLMSINEDYAALFVRADAPWQTLGQLERDVRSHPGKLKASGTASGGAWHLALAGWLTASGLKADDVTWVSSTGAGPSLQELISGGLDMVCCSLPEGRTLYESGQVRALGVMAPQRAQGFPEVKTFAEQGSDWSLGAWRGLAVPKQTPRQVVDVLVAAIERIVTGKTKIIVGYDEKGGRRIARFQTFPEFMAAEHFDNTWRRPEPFRRFLAETDTKLGRLLTSDAMKSVNTDRFSPMIFPNWLMGLLAVTLAGLAFQRLVGRRGTAAGELAVRGPSAVDGRPTGAPTLRGMINFGVIAAAVVVYLLLAEVVGFVLLAGTILFVMLCWLGTRAWTSALICVVLVPIIYQMFANVLRVPLPRGLLGW